MNIWSRFPRTWALLFGLALVFLFNAPALPAGEAFPNGDKGYIHIAVLGDPHLPGNHPDAKRSVFQEIDRWPDVDFVVTVGDVCATTGTVTEYAYVQQTFARLNKPLLGVVGNHDYVFSDSAWINEGAFKMNSPEERSTKLDRFMKAFNMRELSYTRTLGRYHLIFLSLDSLDGKTYATISPRQLKWLEWEFYANRDKTIIVFTHAPLWPPQVTEGNPKLCHFVTQPQKELCELVLKHPGAKFWVCGHVHLGALNPAAVAPFNQLGSLQVINNCDLDGRSILHGTDHNLEHHGTLWTSSLYLYPDRLMVKVFDHTAGKWLEELTRVFPLE